MIVHINSETLIMHSQVYPLAKTYTTKTTRFVKYDEVQITDITHTIPSSSMILQKGSKKSCTWLTLLIKSITISLKWNSAYVEALCLSFSCFRILVNHPSHVSSFTPSLVSLRALAFRTKNLANLISGPVPR